MKKIKLLALSALILLFSACDSDDSTDDPQTFGTFEVKFDNVVGSEPMSLEAEGSDNYKYSTASGEAFNLSKFGYYISKIKLAGPNGEAYEDEMNVSANADEVKGYYHVLESETSSQFLNLKNVPAGTYNKITFTVGIAEDGVQEGAAGGVLDPAEGAWFWNWNAGYIGFSMEGGAENSGQERVEGDGWVIPENSFDLHIGGWKEVSPGAGEDQKFVNNVKTITLDFDANIRVAENLEPAAHIVVDALKILDGVNIDFSSTYSVHVPILGQPFADYIPEAFILDHTHQ